VAPFGLRGCKNRPAPFPGWRSYKALVKAGFFCLSFVFRVYVLFWLSCVQSSAWKDLSPEWSVMCRVRRKALYTHSLTHSLILVGECVHNTSTCNINIVYYYVAEFTCRRHRQKSEVYILTRAQAKWRQYTDWLLCTNALRGRRGVMSIILIEARVVTVYFVGRSQCCRAWSVPPPVSSRCEVKSGRS